jgi:hypothetical protein
MKQILFILFLISFYTYYIRGQNIYNNNDLNHKIQLTGRTYKDSIILRWAPFSPELWQMGNNVGYIIERLTIITQDSFILPQPERIILTPKPVKPLSLNEMEKIANNDKYTAIVAQAIYGETFTTNTNINNNALSFLNTATEIQNRFSFALFSADMSVKAAKAHGLLFVDKSIKKGEKYLYRVYLAQSLLSVQADTGLLFINASDIFELPKPIDLEARWGDKMIELSWNREFFERIYVSYIIERSDDKGKTFKQVNNLPTINLDNSNTKSHNTYFYLDSIPQNNFIYVFRVKGVTPFGEISPPSDTIMGMGKNTIPYINPFINANKLLDNNSIEISWNIPEENIAYIKGFGVERSDKSEGPFRLLNKQPFNPSCRNFIDSFSLPVNYYRVYSIDQYGSAHYSFPSLVQLPDSIPPAPPKNINGFIDSSGIVYIYWGKNNEPDLEGYSVYFSNNINSEFIKVNTKKITDTSFTDTTTLKTLSKNIYYRIKAYDGHYNYSDFSEILTLARPDIVPPSPPLIYNAFATDTGNIIEWYPSPSDDVSKHLIYRKNQGEKNWTLINIFRDIDTQNIYFDNAKTNSLLSEYLIIAVDRCGLESKPSNIVKIVWQEPDITNQRPLLEGYANYRDKTIELKWKRVEGAEKYCIYRQVNDEKMQLYRSVPGNVNVFVDEQVVKDSVYKYYLIVLYIDKIKSKPSNESIIKF